MNRSKDRPDMLLEAIDIRKAYPWKAGEELEVLAGVSFEIDHGEFVSVLGPSGCGKSTFLRLLAGLEQPSSGRVLFDRRPIGGPSCKVGVIFQRSTLFPWLTLAGNVEFGLYAVSSAEGAERKMALQFLDEVGLGGFEDARPDEVSGGMVQRATLARALAARPRVLLLDEPFSALDAISRLEMHQVLLEMWARTHMAIVFVTHDIDEAVELGDRVLIMGPRPGRFIGEEHVTLPRPRVMEGVVSDGFEAVRNQVARVSRAIFSGA